MYRWKPEKIRFMKDASEFGYYNEMIGDWLKQYIEPEDHVCDAGCGLGYLSLELSAAARQVTSVDIHDGALQVLRENISKKGITNINAVLSSIHNLEIDEKFDKMVFCFFGGVDEILEISKRLCRGDVFMVTRNYHHHRFSKNSEIVMEDRVSFEETCKMLEERNVEFETKEMELEFGQPFRYLSEVPKFFQLYSKDTDTVGFTKEELEGMVFETERDDFRFYLPKKRKIGIIRITHIGEEA